MGDSTPTPSQSQDEEFDPATLPPIESLGPDSDYTLFLRKGVPEALKLAALRKAWMLDPKIRDFRSPAIEYGWDFTTPEYALRPTDDVAKLVDQIFGAQRSDAPAAAAAPAQPEAEAVAAAPAVAAKPGVPENKADAASEPVPPLPESHEDDEKVDAPRRKHGGALPG